jgi:hypothetical protein
LIGGIVYQRRYPPGRCRSAITQQAPHASEDSLLKA